jgi:REP element-mobilizing transposase RayT
VFSLKDYLVWCPKDPKRILVDVLAKRLRGLLYHKAKEIQAEMQASEATVKRGIAEQESHA